MVKKIALEEHFLDPATEPYWRPTMVDVAPAKTAQLYAALTDFGEQRLKMMEQHGIARAILAIAGPGVQVERDATTAVRAARASNDFLAKEIQKRPDRYSGFAHLAMQDAKAAADELERCVRDLKFCGAMINGHTNGKYLDDRSYDPFWERAAALDAPVYVHPADPVAALPNVYGTHHIGASTDQAQDAIAAETVRIVSSYKDTGKVPNVVNLAKKTPASHMLVVRHRDRPGVLAHVFDHLRAGNINVQETENVVFDGAKAAVARIHLNQAPSDGVVADIQAATPDILEVTLLPI